MLKFETIEFVNDNERKIKEEKEYNRLGNKIKRATKKFSKATRLNKLVNKLAK